MIKTHITLSMILLLFFPFGTYGQDITGTSPDKVLPGDLSLIIGHWEGTLTYLDYSSNKPYSMPANLVMKPGRNAFQLRGSHVYPNEPKANTNFKLKLSKSGTKLNTKDITARKILPDGQVQIITKYEHKDGNEGKMATNRITYTIGLDKYSVRKDVQFDGSTDWIMRNEYRYQKK
jgi:hypothetical protein